MTDQPTAIHPAFMTSEQRDVSRVAVVARALREAEQALTSAAGAAGAVEAGPVRDVLLRLLDDHTTRLRLDRAHIAEDL